MDLLRSERGRWDDLLARVKPEWMAEQGACGEWTVKDVIAHLTAWEQRPVVWLEAAQTGEEVRPADWPTGLEEDQTNAWIYGMNRDRPLGEVLEESMRVHERLVELIEALTEQDLTAPDRIKGLGGGTLLDAIPGDSYEHYHDHRETIKAWLERPGA